VKQAIPNDKKAAYEKRGEAMKKAAHRVAASGHGRGCGWFGLSRSPTARLSAEVANAVKTSTGRSFPTSADTQRGWPMRFFKREALQWIGGLGGFRPRLGRRSIAARTHKAFGAVLGRIQGDGDR